VSIPSLTIDTARRKSYCENHLALSKDCPSLKSTGKSSNTSMDKPHYQQNSATHQKNPNQIRCLQLNLQHSRSAIYDMRKVIGKEEPDLILIQEPYEYQNRPVRIVKKYRIFTAGKGKHRAAIVIPNNKIDAMLITQHQMKTRYF
jgi:hypothetical protein